MARPAALVLAAVLLFSTVFSHVIAQTITVGVGAVPRAVSTEDLSQIARYVWMYMYDRLVWLDEEGNIVPALAKSWSNPEPTVWRLDLRDDVTWHNGDQFTAQDVAFTFDWVFDPANNHPFRSQLSALQEISVEVVDDYTVDLVSQEPLPVVLSELLQLNIVPNDFGGTDLESFRRNPIGTGAFEFADWSPGDFVQLTANEEYWDGPPSFDELIFRALPEVGSRIAALESGQIQAASDIIPEEVPALKASGFQVLVEPTGQTMTVLIPQYLGEEFPALNDVRVRQALDHALDKEGMVEFLTLGLGQVAQGQRMPPNTFGFNPDISAREYDPDLAKQMLEEAGYPDGFDLVLEASVGRYFKGDEVAELIAAQWRAMGIDVELTRTESGRFIEKWLAADFDGVTFAGQNVAPSMDYQAQTTSFVCDFAGQFMCDERYEELYEQQLREIDRDRRLELLHELVERDFELTRSIPLFVIPGIHALAPNIQGATITSDNHIDLRKATIE